MENTDNRYEGRKLRSKIYKELDEHLSIARLQEILGCGYNDTERAMKKLENDGYVEGNPVDTALCWGCRWVYGQPDQNGNRCSWAHSLTPRSEWVENVNYLVTIREPKTGEKGLCVQKCKGFDLNCYKLEKKYIIAILLKFYQKIDPEAFTKTFFVKAKSSVFDTWLQLFNDFRDLIDFPPLSIEEPETYDDLTEEDYEVTGLVS